LISYAADIPGLLKRDFEPCCPFPKGLADGWLEGFADA